MAQPTGLVPITKTETLSVIEKGMQLASKTVESTHKEIVPVEQSETIKGGDHIMIGDESVANGAQPLHPRGSENDRNQEQPPQLRPLATPVSESDSSDSRLPPSSDDDLQALPRPDFFGLPRELRDMIYLYLVNSECETSFLLVSRAMTLETIKLVHDHRACRVIIGHPNILGINDVNVKHLDHCSIKNFNIDIWTGFYYRHSNLPRFDNILGRDTCCVTLKAQSLAYPLQAAKLHSHLEDFHGSKTVRIYLHAGVYRHSSDRRIAQDYEGISEETRSKEFASQKEIFATLAISLAKALGPSELHDDQDPKARHLEFHPVQHKIGNLELKREKLRDEAEYSVAKRIRKE